MAALTSNIAAHDDAVDLGTLFELMYGLRSLPAKVPEAAVLFGAIESKLRLALAVQPVGGLRALLVTMGNSTSSPFVTVARRLCLERAAALSAQPAVLPTEDLVDLAHTCVRLRDVLTAPLRSGGTGLRRESADGRAAEELRASVYSACAAELATRTPPESTSWAESELRGRAAAYFWGHRRVRVRPGPAYLHAYEADIVVDVLPRLPGGRGTTINVEVDGPHHQRDKRRRRDAARDAHLLREGGVRVLRFDIMSEGACSAAFKAILGAIAEAVAAGGGEGAGGGGAAGPAGGL